MRELYRLRKRIESADELLKVVRTMKTLAAVNIRQYEQAVSSLRRYVRTVEMGFQVVLVGRPELIETASTAAEAPVGAIVFGSDQGMCGGFNERVADHAKRSLRRRGIGPDEGSLILVGHRAGYQFLDTEFHVQGRLELPSSIEGVSTFTRRLLSEVDAWREERGVERILLYFNESEEGARFSPTTFELLPIDRHFLEQLAEREWNSRTEPMHTLSGDELFSALVREYLYARLFRACAESLASENAARLMSMQSAQKNVTELLDDLRGEYRRTRQSSITAELLDIIGGFEAAKRPSDAR